MTAPISVPAALPFSPWCNCTAKRALDLLCSSVMLLATLPVMLLAAALVAMSSPGPVLFRHRRLGKGGREIELLKFRTMVHRPERGGPEITRGGDGRITAVGRLLRKWKLDELPQLANVLRGEMSMVGPRPDMAKYFRRLTPSERRVLLLRPGITSPATLAFRNEEQLLATVPEAELETFYCTAVLPKKVALEAQYAQTASLTSDVLVLMSTAGAILWGRKAPSDRHNPV
jgi:lipopolysaccharide/colanic/teichoic acid biosynthesis glycosyltransferase